ncbi:MAG: sodium:alanine symporter family protein [Verrucomicrobia bacterium]|nr:sodium:alanine symporter family protein [Verrucomicrobiota bacterium]MBS0645620.1 sodium:alanine symporter family protein [Verrucomicrobiota bacterium]
MDWITFFQKLDMWIWQPLFVVLVAIGLYLTWQLRGLQFRHMGYSLKLAFSRQSSQGAGDISNFQALTTALAATIGIGNIAGIATAITMGGLGALFWLWVTSLIGMAIKYAEAVLAIRYRTVDAKGEMAGGPMYYLRNGLGWKKMAFCFALFGALTTIATGNIVQSNSIALAISGYFSVPHWIIGFVLAVCTGAVLIGGIKWIGKVTAYFVPFMGIVYLGGCIIVLALRFAEIPHALSSIFVSAFTGQAAVGGFVGSTMLLAMQMGLARGVFSNESGLGSAPIAAAAAKTNYASHQALISMAGALMSTIVCTFTGLALAVCHVIGEVDGEGKLLNGAMMTVVAFERTFPFGGLLVIFSCILFGLSTIIGWAYYGEKCCEYLLGARSVRFYRILFTLSVWLGVAVPLEIVWPLADIANALMALPNLLGVLALTGVVCHETKVFLQSAKQVPTL